MKFRNKKTGEIYDMTSKDCSGSGFCREISCSDCPIIKRRGDLSCRDWVLTHANMAALAMGRELFGELRNMNGGEMKMNRELLFRGFHPCDGPDTIVVDGKKVNGIWVEGFPYFGEYSGAFILRNKARKRRNARTGEITLKDDVAPFEVLPSTVGQYTGLKDRNEKQIFEHDKLKWDEKEWGGEYIEKVSWDYDLMSMRESEWMQFCEVVGTIFDEVPNE